MTATANRVLKQIDRRDGRHLAMSEAMSNCIQGMFTDGQDALARERADHDFVRGQFFQLCGHIDGARDLEVLRIAARRLALEVRIRLGQERVSI